MAIRKKATRRTKAKRKKTPVTKTATPTKTKTVRNNKRAMKGSPLLAPQLITGARMLYLVWIPEDPSAVAALVPKELRPEAPRSVFMNQYVVDNAEQTSSAGLPGAFGAYSLTYLGADLEGLDAPAYRDHHTGRRPGHTNHLHGPGRRGPARLWAASIRHARQRTIGQRPLSLRDEDRGSVSRGQA
jgi:hypothetical protein